MGAAEALVGEQDLVKNQLSASPPCGAGEAERREPTGPPRENDEPRARVAASAPEDHGTDEPAGPPARPAIPATPRSGTASHDAPGDTAPAARPLDPLLECLVAMTTLLERPQSADALVAGLPIGDAGLTPALFIRAAERVSISARLVRRELDDIPELLLPCVLLLADGGACVLLEREGETTASVTLPETGRGAAEVPLDDLRRRYTGHVLFARPEYRFDARSAATENEAPYHWFWGALAKFWKIYAQVGIASLFVNLFAIASPLFIMNVYDRVVPNRAESTLWVLALGIVTVLLFDFVLRNLRAYFIDTAGRSADVILASRIFQQILGIRMAARPASAGALANQLREFESLRDFFTSATLVSVIDLPFILLFVAMIFYVGGWIGIIPLLAVPAVIGAGYLLHRPLANIVGRSARELAQKHALLVESISGLETIKSLGAEGRIQRRWEAFVGATSKSAMQARSLSQLGLLFTNLVIQLTTIAVVVGGVLTMIYGEGEARLTIGALIACTILTGRAMAPLGQIAAVLVRFDQAVTALRTLDSIMRLPVERPAGSAFLHRPHLHGAVEFKDVTFRYPNQDLAALDNVSFTLPAGGHVGIIGRIGSGKSTIERLLLGLYAPQSGSVRIDGTDIQQIDPADLRRNIGYVPQDVFLFYGSVRDNIAAGAAEADDAAILRAARIAGVDNFISKHPRGFDLQVGERGEAISGGQRQAIAIARALVSDPPILVLDEPTSAMDKGSEQWFLGRFAEIAKGRTLIVVTQRVSMLALVDHLLVMDDGKLVTQGPKDEVLASLGSGKLRGAAL